MAEIVTTEEVRCEGQGSMREENRKKLQALRRLDEAIIELFELGVSSDTIGELFDYSAKARDELVGLDRL